MRLNDALKLRKVGRNYFIVDPGKKEIDFSDIYTLNQEAAFLWEQFRNQDFTEDMMVKCLSEEYDVTPEQAVKDIRETITVWKEFGLLI